MTHFVRTASALLLLTTFGCAPDDPPSPVSDIDLSRRSLAPADVDVSLTGHTVPPSLAPGERRAVQVTLQNTGTRDWAPGTVALVPVDPAWRWPVRVVSSPVAAGASVTFSFVVTAPAAPGPSAVTARAYSLFAGEQGVFGAPISLPVQVDAGRVRDFACGFDSSDLPATLTPGERRLVNVTVRNTGTVDWPGDGSFCLYQRDDVPDRWGGRFCAPLTSPVAAGATGTVQFPIDAPETPGTYAFRRQLFDSRGPANGGIGFFDVDTPCVDLSVTVGGTPPLDATIVRHTLVPALDPGERVRASVTVQNTGSTDWPADGSIVLHSTTMPVTLFGRHVARLPGPVAAGETVTFEVPVRAPLAPGAYAQQWRMFAANGQFFGSGLSVPTTVSVPPAGFDAEVVQSDLPVRYARGLSGTYEVRLRNNGAQAWPGDSSLALTYEGLPANQWGLTAVPLTTPVAPGGEVSFSLGLTAPAVDGRYRQRWRLTGPAGAFGEAIDVEAEVTETLGALSITTASLPGGSVGLPYDLQLSFAGAESGVWTITGVPAGLVATAQGRIFGTPSSVGVASVNLSIASPGLQTAQVVLPLDVRDPPSDVPRYSWGRFDTLRSPEVLVWDGARVWDLTAPGAARDIHTLFPNKGVWQNELVELCLSRPHAVWADDRLLVFGGRDCVSNQPVARGWSIDPFVAEHTPSTGYAAQATRRALPPASGARAGGRALWTGQEMVVIGGTCVGCTTQGERYLPALDAWSPLSPVGAPTVGEAVVAEWTGTQVLVFGGSAASSGRWVRANNTWLPMASPPEPLGVGVSVWTGSALIVWDGARGGRYDPVSDTWSMISTTGAPIASENLRAVWTGTEMVVLHATGGGHYDPALDRWRVIVGSNMVLPTPGAPIAWTGRQVAVGNSTLGVASYRPLSTAETGICRRPIPIAPGALVARISGGVDNRTVEDDGSARVEADPSGGVPPYRMNFFLNGVFARNTTLVRTSFGLTCPDRFCAVRMHVADDLNAFSCDEQLWINDAPPSLQINAPAPGAVVAPGPVNFSMGCADAETGCQVRFQGGFGASALAGQVDLTGFAGLVNLWFEATDDIGNVTRRRVTVDVQPSAP